MDAVPVQTLQIASTDITDPTTISRRMRIAVEDDTLFSEISANKYLLSVRFLKSERDKKAQIVSADVPFKLTLCQL
jgi:cell division protein ZapD